MNVAASTYLNSAPLVYSFAAGAQRHQVKFIGDAAPARCAQLLAADQCDAALIPVIEYGRIPNLRIIPEVAVASKNRVRSVLLATRCPLEKIQAVTLDTSSRTSQALVRILLAEQFGIVPRFAQRTPDAQHDCENMFEAEPGFQVDAALVIGDPAFRIHDQAARLGVQIYDLAEEWKKMTGLPFVFAVWAVNETIWQQGRIVPANFAAAKQEGLAHLDEITRSYSLELNQPQENLLAYLTENVNFDLDEENLAGMQLYFDLAHHHGLIEQEVSLRFTD